MQATRAVDAAAGERRRERGNAWLPAGGLLVGAAVVVGLAIAAEGSTSRVLNGVGAIGWIAAAVLLVRSLRGGWRWFPDALVALGAAVVLAVLVRPSDLVAAVVGFGVAGAVVAVVVRERPLGWALLVPAAYLPVHVALAVGRSLLAGATRVRTEPPPTAAVVPLAMVLAAVVAGLGVAWVRRRMA